MVLRIFSVLMASLQLAVTSCAATEVAPKTDAPPKTEVEVVANAKIVKDMAQLQAALNEAKPGETIALASGEWKDASILFQANGTKDAPITLTAETKGMVTLTGKSEVRLAGEYLVLSGLVFKDGYAPSKTVISFRKDSKAWASNSRVSECVVQNYNQPDGADEKWISIYGKNNRVDHNYLEGKSSEGTTLVVWLEDEESRENNHRIDYNFFGHRPTLGRNGAETIRIGTSSTSMYNSNTTVENNFFYRCDGEAEIISIKSAQNVVQNNVFYESKGSVVLRHGNNNTIRGNYFIGNKVSDTGGIRVINQGHQVYNNFLQELSGTSNKASLVVMNGVVNSELNGYHQVKDVVIKENTFINCSNWELGNGTLAGQTLLPENTLITNNLYYNLNTKQVYKMPTPLPGIVFSDNTYKLGSAYQAPGFSEASVYYIKGSNGIYKKQGTSDVVLPVQQDAAGPAWFKKNM